VGSEMCIRDRPQMCEGPAKEWRPSNQEVLREYELNIRFLHRGCVVQVGCKSIAFEDVTKAMAELNEYVSGDTWEVQQKWRKLLDS
jgi:hypothetical protein